MYAQKLKYFTITLFLRNYENLKQIWMITLLSIIQMDKKLIDIRCIWFFKMMLIFIKDVIY